MNQAGNGAGLNRPRSHWQILYSIIAALALALAIALPVTGYTIVNMFRTILYEQVQRDNDSISHLFESFLKETYKNAESEEKWLEGVRQFADRYYPPNRGYVCMVDSESRFQVYPNFIEPTSARNMVLIPYDEMNERYKVDMPISIQELLNSKTVDQVSGQFRQENGSQIIDFRRVMIGGRPWLIGIHQLEDPIVEQMKMLFPYIVSIGVILFICILLPFTLFCGTMIRQHENERNKYVSQIEEHSSELERIAEQLQETNSSLTQMREGKDRLYRRLSHDLRAPLNSIISSCSLVSEGVYGDVNDKQRHAMVLVERNTNVLLKLIDGILELSRLESGRVKVEPEPFALEDLVRELAENMRPLAESKGLEIRYRVENGLPIITTDRNKLYLILQNLTGNAIQFTQQGVIEIYAAIEKDGEILLSVRDTGEGIPEEEQKNIFEEFTRVSSIGNGSSGIGLGLTITRELTQLLGGNISVESRMGEGSTFTLHLPLQAQPA